MPRWPAFLRAISAHFFAWLVSFIVIIQLPFWNERDYDGIEGIASAFFAVPIAIAIGIAVYLVCRKTRRMNNDPTA